QKAISSPLLEGVNIKGAKSVLLNVTGSGSMTMQEINEGNNVIFEAAGEEANVIFGVVKKDEMNDYISYTVIATGFDTGRSSFASRNLKSITKEEPKENKFRGGFSFFDNPEFSSEDLEVPTILRVKSPKSSLEDDQKNKDKDIDNDNQTGFSVDASRYAWSKEKAEKKDDSDDDESSSFLRMIMD